MMRDSKQTDPPPDLPSDPAVHGSSPAPASPPGPAAEVIIGIDLGTTNSLVAYCDEKGPRILPVGPGEMMLPSVVRYDADAKPVALGEQALAHAVAFPQNTIFSIKRLMGRGLADIADELTYLPYQVVPGDHNTARVQIGTAQLAPQQISAHLLGELRKQAQQQLGLPVRKAVITVPAYFDDAQRQATRDSGRIAGLEVVRIVNEPTAAALAYHLGQNKEDQTIAVFDLGGGTFDISILRLAQTDTGTVDQVLATDGDTHLGGDDVDQMIIGRLQQDIGQQFGKALVFPPGTVQALRLLAKAGKEKLSTDDTAWFEIDLGEERTFRQIFKQLLSRDELEAMMRPWIDKAMICCKRALRSAKLSPSDIDRVILVGGSTRIPLVRQRVAALFDCEPYVALDPDQVVAMGAAVQGAILAGTRQDMLLLDVIPLSLGIETLGGAVAKLIVANSAIPARATEMFSTSVDGQTNVKIHVLQGERELVKDCRSLGQFELQGIPPMPAGLAKLEVTFLVDANGILTVYAVEKRSEKAARIQIIPAHGLTRSEVAQMEAASITHAQADMTAHQLIDLRNQARLDVRAIENQLNKVGDLIDADYRKQIQKNMQTVKAFLQADQPDASAFQQALEQMDQGTVRLAEVAVTESLKGM